MEFFSGVWEFCKNILLVFLIIELSQLIEESISARLELRKGFAGTKTTPFKVFARHSLMILRADGSLKQHLAAGANFLIIFLAAGLIPTWAGKIALNTDHSLWLFLALVILSPVAHLIIGWSFMRGGGWPATLFAAERTIGCATVHFILAIALSAITGVDSFSQFKTIQNEHGWLIFNYPFSIFILFSYSVANLFTSFQTVFSRNGDEKSSEWSSDQLLPSLRRTVWTLFIVDVFLGGAGSISVVGEMFLIAKCLAVNTLSYFGAQLFFHLREDQAESFILWKLAPIAILILGLSLLFPGGIN